MSVHLRSISMLSITTFNALPYRWSHILWRMSLSSSSVSRLYTARAHLSIRFISWRPSPLRKRSRLLDSMRQEQRASKRFSIISCSSAVDGLWRLNTWKRESGTREREREQWSGEHPRDERIPFPFVPVFAPCISPAIMLHWYIDSTHICYTTLRTVQFAMFIWNMCVSIFYYHRLSLFKYFCNLI